MPRKNLIRTGVFPYHVCARSNNREWFYAPLAKVWETFEEYLCKIQDVHGVDIHAFVLMSNHFHLLISTPQSNLDSAMLYLMREVCRSINRSSNRINHLFGGPYKWSVIYSAFKYDHALKYVYRNPVKAQLCQFVEDYPYSSLKKGAFKVSQSTLATLRAGLPEIDRLRWLNEPYSPEEDDCVRRALRRREFKITPVNGRKNLPFELME